MDPFGGKMGANMNYEEFEKMQNQMLGLVTLGNEDSDDDDVPLFNPADMGKF